MEWPGHTHNSTILLLKDAHSPGNLTDNQKSTNNATISLDNTEGYTMTSMTFHHTPSQWHNPLPVWVEQHHLHMINHLSYTDSSCSNQNVPAIPPGSLSSSTDWTGLGGSCQDEGEHGKGKKSNPAGTTITHVKGPAGKALKFGASKPASIIINAHKDPARPRVKSISLVIKTALLWTITGLLFRL